MSSLRYIVIISAALLCACGFSRHTERAADVDPRGWSDPVSVSIENSDTIGLQDISFFVRTTEHFTAPELSVTVTVRAPDGSGYSEPFTLAFDRSRAVKSATHYEFTIPYRNGNLLHHAGAYDFTVAPAHETEGVTSLGVKTAPAR